MSLFSAAPRGGLSYTIRLFIWLILTGQIHHCWARGLSLQHSNISTGPMLTRVAPSRLARCRSPFMGLLRLLFFLSGIVSSLLVFYVHPIVRISLVLSFCSTFLLRCSTSSLVCIIYFILLLLLFILFYQSRLIMDIIKYVIHNCTRGG